MELRSHKRKRSSVGSGGGRDRLSEMPDEVLVHILSYMPIVYAVRTVLLRPFGNLWTLVPTLKLDMLGFLGSFWTNHEWEEKDEEHFCIFVRNVLALHKSPTIDKFYLCIEFYDSWERIMAADDIKTWLRFAMDRKANEIKFSDGLDYGRTFSSLLPNFTSQSLVTLALGFCTFDAQLQVNLPSLQKLSLDHCRMSNVELQAFISGCCSLQELVIVEPSDFGRADRLLLPNFTSQSLFTLALVSCKVETRHQVNLPSLKKLSLDHCRMSDGDLQEFSSGCHSLQELVIVEPFGINRLSFSAPNVDKLSLVLSLLTFKHQRNKRLWLDCPNIKSLDLEIHGQLDIINVSSVREIYIKEVSYGTENDCISVTLHLLYGKFYGAEVIHLSCVATQQFLDTELNFLSWFEYKWKRVVLELKELHQVDLTSIDRLMTSLSHLEELTIYTTEDFKASTDLSPFEVFSDDARQLKTIKLYGYGKSWKTQLQLVEFLLKCADGLSELFIFPINHRLEAAEELEFVKSVSRLPRASTNAKVLFE